ncbi:MAG: FeoA family protein [Anaerovoracaceae bacterium]
MTLDKLTVGETAKVIKVNGEGEIRRHLLAMGITPGTEITLRKKAPMGDPLELKLRGYVLSIRKNEAVKIEVGN